MTARILPVDEWPRLAGTLLEPAWPTFDPDRTQILVLEHDGQIVACVAQTLLWHLEGAWIAPAHRKKTAVARRLWACTRQMVRDSGAREVWTMAVSADARRWIPKLGAVTRLACAHFAVRF